METDADHEFRTILEPKDFDGQDIESEQILSWFQLADAAWVHDGDSQKPHAELTSGLCSNGYFDCSRVLKYPTLCEILAVQLIRRIEKMRKSFLGSEADWVIGSAYASITFSYEVARNAIACHGYVEKDPNDPRKMTWSRFQIPAGGTVVQIEELITTLGTTREVRRAVQEGNKEPIEFLPIVGTIIHRPSKLPVDYGDIQVVSLVKQEVWTLKPEDCPLCRAGSPRLRPKAHWAELTGKK